MAGVAGLEPVTSAVTGQRSNQLSYTPAKGDETLKFPAASSFASGSFWEVFCASIKIRAADAKEVGVGNPAEETFCYPNIAMLQAGIALSIILWLSATEFTGADATFAANHQFIISN